MNGYRYMTDAEWHEAVAVARQSRTARIVAAGSIVNGIVTIRYAPEPQPERRVCENRLWALLSRRVR